MKIRRKKQKIFTLLFILIFTIFWKAPIFASRVNELRTKIEDYNDQIEKIQKEIEIYQNEINKSGKEANTLKNQVKQLENTIKNLQANIRLTERKISSAVFIIEELAFSIKSKEEEINSSKKLLKETLKKINELESESLVEILLANSSFSDFFNNLEYSKNYQNDINLNLQQLKESKTDLEKQEQKKENEKRGLQNLYSTLSDQKSLVEDQKGQKNVVLKETKNKESIYKKLLADRLAKAEALENEIRTLEEQIRVEIDPRSLPSARPGVLAWPIDNYPAITQYFGNTPFATQNPQIYGGNGHNGIDLRASIGTPIKSSLAGKVVDIGNTDASCKGVSYGKWVLIEHGNNISTLYTHLSLIKVNPSDSVETGQIIGYSGDTGYVTGPHLHFTVYASSAVKISAIKSKVCGTIMKLPIAPYNGYLNPLSYL